MPEVRTAPTGSTGVGGRAAGVGGSDFAPLLRAVKEQGLLERRTGWYARRIAANLLALAGVLTGLVLLGDSWWALLLALPLAVLWSRTAFVGHDAGHAQITGDRRASRIIGLVHANLLLGMSEAWWNDKHNRHHANPNHIDKDPDVAADVLVFTQKQAAERDGFRRWLTRHQAWLFFPLTLLEGIALKIYGFQDLRRQPAARARLWRHCSSSPTSSGYATLLLTTMSARQGRRLRARPPGAVRTAPGHGLRAEPQGHGDARPGRRALGPSAPTGPHLAQRTGAVLTDWFLGGLNYQIEHHLFPSMPRPHLRLAQPLVRAHCRVAGHPVRGDRPRRLLPAGAAAHARGRRTAEATCPDGSLRQLSE